VEDRAAGRLRHACILSRKLVLPAQRHHQPRRLHAEQRLVRTRLGEYLAPNAVAEAAKDLGITDDRIRLAIARAGLIAGRRIGKWEVAVEAALEQRRLTAPTRRPARSPEIEARLRASTAEFHALRSLNVRPS
jgi:3-oxoacyl-(acyl-carrier-protein) synthase